jgi:glutathione peroxidase
MATETAKEADKPATNDSVKAIYDLTVKDMDGKDVALSKYKGDVLLIVNTASK